MPNNGGVGTSSLATSAVTETLLYESKIKSKPAPNLKFVGRKVSLPDSSYFIFGPRF